MSIADRSRGHMETLILMIGVINLVASWENQQTVQVVTTILIDTKCPATVAVFDCETNHNDQDLKDELIRHQSTPITLLDNSDLANDWNKESVCQNVAIFLRQWPTKSVRLYRQIKNRFFVNKMAIVTRCSDQEAKNILTQISDENLVLIVETLGRDIQLFTWKADNKVTVTTIQRETTVSTLIIPQHAINLSGRHLIIGTLNNPPSVLIDKDHKISGIEPSLLETIAEHLHFTYDYVQASPNEMWGEIFNKNGNLTFTGLLGMLVRKEADVAIGNFYQSSVRWPYVSYTAVYKISYESFLVPAPQPYAKWTALFYSFTVPTWLATIISSFVVAIMLYSVSNWTSSHSIPRHDVFSQFQFCCLYVLGNLLTIQMQPQSILSNANRMFLIWWLFGTLILTTGYKSGLISYMTFPFTPPAIDTLQQLVDSPLKKVIFGTYSKNILSNTSSPIEKRLSEDLIPLYNLTEMYMLLDSGTVAVESNLDNLLYNAATMYPPTAAGPRVHLIKETILPVQAAFGLQKDSDLKPYFDKDIQRLFEAGIVDYHKTKFAKKMDPWNPKKSKFKTSFTLDSLQGAFYLLLIGLVVSTLVFLAELAFTAFKQHSTK